MIWCVEDDASIRDIEVYALRSTGFEAKGFEDGTSFWEALRTGRPELVVLDVMLPGIDGMELLRRMRADAALSDIPVVMATAKGAEYDKIRGLDLGADYYLTKPFGVMELVSCVKAVLRRCGTKTAAQLRCGAAGRNGVADVLGVLVGVQIDLVLRLVVCYFVIHTIRQRRREKRLRVPENVGIPYHKHLKDRRFVRFVQVISGVLPHEFLCLFRKFRVSHVLLFLLPLKIVHRRVRIAETAGFPAHSARRPMYALFTPHSQSIQSSASMSA